MNEKLKEKTKEALSSVLPITLIVLLISVTISDLGIDMLMLFLTGAMLLIVGMGFFQLGAEMSMMPLGQGVGGKLLKARLWILMFICFLMGTIITISEPDLQVLANQVPSIANMTLILTVAVGVGVFLVIAVLRILFHISLSWLLIGLYIGLFILSFFTPDSFTAVAFDSGGVTTGPMTVPFIMALGIGLSAARSDKDSAGDSFGLIALCSVGPILMVTLLGIFSESGTPSYEATKLPVIETTKDVVNLFAHHLPEYAKEVAISILPVIGVFVIFQLFTKAYHGHQILRMTIGFVYTIIGLILFLTGVNVGFAPVGNLIGGQVAGGDFKWLIVPIGMLIGYYIVKAEPAVQVLNEQVEELTQGMVSRKMMNTALSIGVAVAVALAMLRAMLGFDIYYILIPGYLLALVFSRMVSPVFVGIAFDSGGVASGPMTSTFLLPLAIGVCSAAGGNIETDAFGVVALVALAPLIAIQIMGILYAYKSRKAAHVELPTDDIIIEITDDIIDLDDLTEEGL